MNTPLWTSDEVAACAGGTAHGSFTASAVTFDSREVTPGALFVALPGSTTNGHRFVTDAFARGAAGAIVSEPVEGPHVRVGDTLAALEALGRAGRARALGLTSTVAVTGSVGKTTVKELIAAALALQGPTHASVKSYNNHTGVPLSLARMPADTEWGVFELGMNNAGEIARLAPQVRPNVAVVTWIAPAHIEKLGSLEAIADAKAEIFAGLEQDGTAIIPADAPHFRRLERAARRYTDDIISVGLTDEASLRPEDLVEDADGSSFLITLDRTRHAVRVPMPGRHRIQNALATLAAVQAAHGDLETAIGTIGRASELAGRGARRSIPLAGGGNALLIDESYNANPASMAAAIGVLAQLPVEGRRIAVLGAMRELGKHSDAYHRDLEPLVTWAKIDHAILVGDEMAALFETMPWASHVPDWQSALAAVRAELRPGDALLVKGSNSVGLAHLVAALEGHA